MSELASRFWMWLYRKARAHLPPGYYDDVLYAYLQEKLEELRGTFGDDFVLWFVNEMDMADDEMPARDRRDAQRDFHYLR